MILVLAVILVLVFYRRQAKATEGSNVPTTVVNSLDWDGIDDKTAVGGNTLASMYVG